MKKDNLLVDLPIDGQKYALVSIIGPHMNQKCDTWGLKVRGVINSTAEADAMVNEIKQYDQMFDIFLVEVGKFVPLDISPEQIKNQKYLTDELNDIVGSYYEETKKSEIYHKKRVNEAIKENKDFTQSPSRSFTKISFTKKMIEQTEHKLQSLKDSLEKEIEFFDKYTEEEKQEAINNYNEKELNDIIEKNEIEEEDQEEQIEN